MELGDRVVYYTHEASDQTHRTVDQLAFITGIVDDETIDVVAFPPGGPMAFYRASRFNEEDPGNVVGLNYWREVGEAPPDFADAFAYHNNPEWQRLATRQSQELAKVPPARREALLEDQKQQRAELRASLERDYPEEANASSNAGDDE